MDLGFEYSPDIMGPWLERFRDVGNAAFVLAWMAGEALGLSIDVITQSQAEIRDELHTTTPGRLQELNALALFILKVAQDNAAMGIQNSSWHS